MTIQIEPSPDQHVTGPSKHGMVYEPPLLRDALPWPRGMVIAPPPTNDKMSTALPGDDRKLAGWIGSVVEALRSAAQSLL